MRISDWSSDVCSSDLLELIFEAAGNRALDAQPRTAQFVRKAQRGIGYRGPRANVTGVDQYSSARFEAPAAFGADLGRALPFHLGRGDRKSTRLNSSH